mmetsp:Transcript_21419/g.50224  ORF Transcript_21419/g.50224 Transcript_21419/m.50224 type:complete len:201 (+) Transcript_21419:2639-3241(+)
MDASCKRSGGGSVSPLSWTRTRSSRLSMYFSRSARQSFSKSNVGESSPPCKVPARRLITLVNSMEAMFRSMNGMSKSSSVISRPRTDATAPMTAASFDAKRWATGLSSWCAKHVSRISCFLGFPEPVIGNSSSRQTCTATGTLYAARLSAQVLQSFCSISSSRRFTRGPCGSSMRAACTTSPSASSGPPNTAERRMPGIL